MRTAAYVLVALLGLTGSYAPALSEDINFQLPTVDGVAVDRCLRDGQDCDDVAAQHFCKTRQPPFLRSNYSTFLKTDGQTKHLGDNSVCMKDCERFYVITCTNEESDLEAS